MQKNLIGITGKAGAGKSTAARMLQEIARQNGSQMRILPFAEPLKAFAHRLGWDGQKDEKGRRLLQLLGTECGRECIHPDIWVRRWEEQVNAYPTGVISDDVRFFNETEAITKRGGTILRIEGLGGHVGDAHGGTGQHSLPHTTCQGIAANHSSEQVPEFASIIIKNTGTLTDLRTILTSFYRTYFL